MYNLNIDYFKNIDSKEKAYWLGFIYADGSVKNNTLIIQIKDYDHLASFKNAIEFDGPIKVVYGSGYNPNAIHYRLNICRKEFVQPILNLGRYNSAMVFPNIPSELIKSFIIGYFDGDGSVWVSKNSSIIKGVRYTYNKIGFDIIGDFSISLSISDYLTSIGISNKIKNSKSEKMYYVEFSGKKSSRLFENHFYTNDLPVLIRKKEIVVNYNGPSVS